MKKPLLDTKSAPTDITNTKDKRSLVLFLLGLTLLSFDFWPGHWDNVRYCYKVTLDVNSDQWQVLSLPLGDAHDGSEIKKALALHGNPRTLPLIPEQGAAGETPAQLSLFINRPLPINKAGKEALEMLPGIGPHIAGAILDELQHQGKFAGPDDLLKVSGIGLKSMQRLLPLISFE